jgi:hypothetical protein
VEIDSRSSSVAHTGEEQVLTVGPPESGGSAPPVGGYTMPKMPSLDQYAAPNDGGVVTVAGTLLLLGGGCLLAYGLLGILPLLLVLVAGNVLGSLLLMMTIAVMIPLALATGSMGITILIRRNRGTRNFTMIVAAPAILVETLGFAGYVVLVLWDGVHLLTWTTVVVAFLFALPLLAHLGAFGLLARARAESFVP